LFEQGAIPQAALEGEELKYLQAREQVERALPARLAQARASLALAESAYADSLIRAPISGLVTAHNVNPGEMASTMAPVVSLVNIDKVEVKATVGESLVNQLKQGQKVRVIVRAVSGQPFSGTITSVAPAADPVTKGFPVKIEIDNPRHVLKPGMFAEVQVAGAQKEALLVPREAVTRDADKDVVWVVKDGRAQKREVKPGESDGRQIMIAAGLA
ncbi:MAG: efflux RND transporter periplasmic adaptor subunit, partial [Moorella sp. (in: Bacteria)]|nr:efflux RND transporter periplasmic adaptor subunit [Moorella sp. (in: firmicutes)]